MLEHEVQEAMLEELLRRHGEDLVAKARLWAVIRERPVAAGDEAFGKALVRLRNSLNPTSAPREVLFRRLRLFIWKEL